MNFPESSFAQRRLPCAPPGVLLETRSRPRAPADRALLCTPVAIRPSLDSANVVREKFATAGSPESQFCQNAAIEAGASDGRVTRRGQVKRETGRPFACSNLCHFSVRFHAVAMRGGQQLDVAARPTEDHVEKIEDVAAEDAEVGGGRVGEGGELAANDRRAAAIIMADLQRGLHQHMALTATDARQSVSGGR